MYLCDPILWARSQAPRQNQRTGAPLRRTRAVFYLACPLPDFPRTQHLHSICEALAYDGLKSARGMPKKRIRHVSAMHAGTIPTVIGMIMIASLNRGLFDCAQPSKRIARGMAYSLFAMVFTPKQKYKMWASQTSARMTQGIQIPFRAIMKKPKPIRRVTVTMIESLV